MVDPVPLAELFPKPPPLDRHQFDRDNDEKTLTIRARPSQFDTMMMFPCCLFIGCIFGMSSDVYCSDSDQSVTVSNYPGHCCIIPFKQTTHIAYEDIANVCLIYTGIAENHSCFYDPILVTKDKKIWRIGHRGKMDAVQEEVLILHKFLFGRNRDSVYQSPRPGQLILSPPGGYWECGGCYCLSS